MSARWPAAAATAALLAAVAVACNQEEAAPSQASAPAAVKKARPRVPLQLPGELPKGPEGELVRRGRLLLTRTSEELPGLVPSSGLHCTSCHLEAGTRAGAAPWIGVTSVYPEYRSREGHDVTIEERIGACFERSMNGKAPADDSPEMKAMVAYMTWLSQGVPKGSEVEGRGFVKVERPPNVDRANGQSAYLVRCASCHGEDGQGQRAPDGGYRFPPLWGDASFNVGAGMARLDTAAAFVRHNMPLGQPDSLTWTETYDIAAYFTEQPRPDFARRAEDWPKGGKPRDARY